MPETPVVGSTAKAICNCWLVQPVCDIVVHLLTKAHASRLPENAMLLCGLPLRRDNHLWPNGHKDRKITKIKVMDRHDIHEEPTCEECMKIYWSDETKVGELW